MKLLHCSWTSLSALKIKDQAEVLWGHSHANILVTL